MSKMFLTLTVVLTFVLAVSCDSSLLSAPPPEKNLLLQSPPTESVDFGSTVLQFTSNAPATVQVEYGTAAGVYTAASPISSTETTQHSITLSGLTPSTQYYYRIILYLEKIRPYRSGEFTFTTTSNTQSLSISGQTTSSQTSSISFNFTSNHHATASIVYGTATGVYTASTVPTTTPAGSHSITASNLSPGTVYYYRIKLFWDSGADYTSEEFTATTLSDSLSFQANPTVTATLTSLSVQFTPSQACTYFVEYGTSTGTYPVRSTTATAATATAQSVLLPNLTQGTTYYFRVVLIRASGTTLASSEYTQATNLNTLGILGNPAVTQNLNSLGITFTTNNAASSVVEYGTTSGTYTASTTPSTSSVNHSFTLSGLNANTTYYYRIKLFWDSGSDLTSAEYSTATLSATLSFSTTPVATPALNSLSIQFTPSQNCSYYVEYGTSTGNYAYRTVPTNAANSLQTATINGLIQGTTYYYRVVLSWSAGPNVTSTEFSSTTLLNSLGLTGAPTVTPTLTSLSISATSNFAATAVLEYGTSLGTYTTSTLPTASGTSHSFNITGLTASTTYYYRIKLFWDSGSDFTSAEYSTATLSATLSFSTTPVATPALNSLSIQFTPSQNCSYYVEYGTSTGNYAYRTVHTNAANSLQTATINGLVQGTTYYYRVVLSWSAGPNVTSTEFSSTTLLNSLGLTGAPAVTPTLTSLSISATSNFAATAVLEYGTSAGNYTTSTLPTASGTSHSFNITGLTAATTYYYRVKLFWDSGSDFTSAEYSTATSTEAAPTLAQKRRGIWLMGGLSANNVLAPVASVDLYDPINNTWYPTVTNVPVPVSFAGYIAYNDKLYVIGGFDGNAPGTVRNLVQIYDIASNSWSTGAAMTAARANIHAAVSQGRIYIMGGTTGNASVAWAASNTNYEYNIAGNTWNTRAVIGGNSSERFAYSSGETIFNLGGRSTATAVAAAAHDGYIFSSNAATSATEVVIGTAPSVARTGISGGVYKPTIGTELVIMLGGATALTGTTGCFVGQGTTTSTLNQVPVFLAAPFTAPQVWTQPSPVSNYPTPIAFSSAVVSTAFSPARFYNFGGVSALGSTTTVTAAGYWCNVPEITTTPIPAWSVTWTGTNNMPTARWGHGAVTLNQ